MEKRGLIDAHVLAVFPDDTNIVRAVIGAQQLECDVRSGVALSTLRISATPTLLLVGGDGRVLKVWVGQLPAAGEDDVIEAIRNSS